MKNIGLESMWLPLSKLHKWDAACQRNVTSLQHKIAKDFDPRAFGVIHVFVRNGKYFVIDGQNRIAALMLMGANGQFRVPCINHGAITDAEAATIFHEVNTFKSLQAYNIFMAAYIRGENDQVAIVETIRNLGLDLAPGGIDGSISAVKALEKIHRPSPNGEPDPEALRRTLQVIIAAWGKTRDALNGVIIRGLGQVYLRDKQRIDDQEMIRHLAKRPGGPAKLVGDARGMNRMIGGSVSVCVSELIIEDYNHGRRSAERKLKTFRS